MIYPKDMIYPGLVLQNRYRVDRLLGKGGMGETWKVDDRGTPKVLKVLMDNYKKCIELFQREAEVLKQLDHPGIPKVEPDGYFTFQPENSTEPLHCLVMEFIEGQNLQEWLEQRNNQPISQEQAINWLKQLVEILAQVHDRQCFHRDIKPSNIMRRSDGQLVLIDFGTVRKVTKTYIEKHQQGDVTKVYSYGYTAPEQFRGQAVPQSDFFALGRTFVYLLTGKEPIECKEHLETFELQQDWRDSAPLVSKPLADLIDELMALSPENRPENVQAILQHLELLSLKLSVDPILSTMPGILKFWAEQILTKEFQRWKQFRTPKIALYGRTGSGKSSLINAILEDDCADVSVDKRGTLYHKSYSYHRGGWKLNFVDSRGVRDSERDAAFQQAIDYIVREKVDILLFVIPVDERDVQGDRKLIAKLKATHKRQHKAELPVILVLNKIDRVPPVREWKPPYNLSLYRNDTEANTQSKNHQKKEANILKCIQARIEEYETFTAIYVPVCALWNDDEDARYNIDELVRQIYKCIPDEAAKHGFGRVTANIVLKNAIASRFTSVAAGLAFLIVCLPTFNAQEVLSIQKILVRIIAQIAGSNEDPSRAAEQFLKQLGVKPSGLIAALSQTFAIGEAAIRYFIEGESIEQAKQAFVKEEERLDPELKKAESREERLEILWKIDAEISDRYGIAPLYDNQKEKDKDIVVPLIYKR